MRCPLPIAGLRRSRGRDAFFLGAAMFALGLSAGVWLRPSTPPVPVETAFAFAKPLAPSLAEAPLAHRLDRSIAYPAEVIRVIDGDTFEARVRVWPGLDVDTKVRLRGIDAAELHARCAGELAQAQAARAALETLLADGEVAIAQVGIDKYGGRVDATVSTRSNADVSAALLRGGYARAYDGGKRKSWCG